ncbi:riboflavin biosynthesis protein VVA0006-like [Watersipora subatra]|uniref:riboflavin biosynthesis protein VVA0006-like n=1 Tax=Watersipora subatra TaxID=2589382 RepID=UPI00355B2D28
MPKRAAPKAVKVPSAKERRKSAQMNLASTSGESTSSSNAANVFEPAKERFTFFYKKDSPFSQFHSCQFTVAGVTYNCAEQYMMHQKAVMFGDTQMAKRILASSSPPQQKSFGRLVEKFDPEVWARQCREVVFNGNYAKFTQNKNLLTHLIATEGTTLVEASPRDKIWGIGMGANNPLAQNRATWKGRNYLGEALTQVRERIMRDNSTSN